jgi:hypothetical protein
MRLATRLMAMLALSALVLFTGVIDSNAGRSDGLGILFGQDTQPDHFFIGGQAEFGPVTSAAFLVPSFHIAFDDGAAGAANVDLRWYLIPLPETGIRIYGAAGPTLMFASDTEIGLTLTAGLNIPMKNRRRYNVELRFGFGDIPDLKFATALMFGI